MQNFSSNKIPYGKGAEIQSDKNFHISKHLVSLPLNFKNITTTVEPPSPILELKVSADQMSDDPLSNNVYMVLEHFCVCAWSAHTGFSYIGTPSSIVS